VYIFSPYEQCAIRRNVLFLTLQPDEGFGLRFAVKAPGPEFRTRTQVLHFRYEDVFGALPDAYETLLLDVLQGEQTLFVRADEVETAWRLCQPVLEPAAIVPMHTYRAGTWGPAEARALLAEHGGRWQVR
jgi:glucose-6-phosphate 1-dehydrogenase